MFALPRIRAKAYTKGWRFKLKKSVPTLRIAEIRFHAELANVSNAELCHTLRGKLMDLAGRIHTTLSGEWEVHVTCLRSVDENWLIAGDHRFIVFADDKDDRVKVGALVISLQSMLPLLTSEQALAIAIARPGRLVIREEHCEDAVPIASPHEERLIGEWVPECPRYTRKQWIVSDRIMQSFEDAVSIIRNSDKIYKDWGFEEIDPNPRAILCFYGPAGTGKTMAAHVLASELGRKILCAKYSQIESKYVGDAPKNLRRVFSEAKETGAVLFFDEADSFLGKRMENVSSGSEQAINSLRGEMLILLEDFQGVVVFATNLVTNIDRAFESRIISKIEFEMPNAEARRAMILSKIPSKAPLEPEFGEHQLEKLVSISEGFSGRVIRSAMLMSFVKAARNSEMTGNDLIRYTDFEQAFLEQKETAKRLDSQYRRAATGKEVINPQQNQEILLELASKAMAPSESERDG